MSDQAGRPKFELTALFIPDKKTGYFSAFFAQFPEVIAQGKNEADAESNLYDIFAVMLQDRKRENMKRVCEGEENYTSKNVKLVTA
jgi:predicted RNase H-like HicB family nuclease